MTGELIIGAYRALDASGDAYANAKWFFYEAGTTVPQVAYADAALTVALANPVVADSGGKFPSVYADAAKQYRAVLKTADEATVIYDIDPINTGVLSQLALQVAVVSSAEARAELYGIQDELKAKAFGAYGVELDFASGIYRKGYQVASDLGGLDDMSFARPSLATFETAPGVVQNYPSGEARIIPEKGLVVEYGAQNILLRSSEFDHATWFKRRTGTAVLPTVVANDAVAPDGTTTADKVTLNLGGGSSGSDHAYVEQSIATTVGAKYAGTMWVKGVDGEKILYRHIAGGSYAIHTFNGAWQRIGRVETAAGATGTFEIALRGTLGSSASATFHAWGAQLELGDAPTSLMPTTDAAATRREDTAYLENLLLAGCSVLIDATITGGGSDTKVGSRVFLTLYSGDGSQNRISLVNDGTGGIRTVVEANDLVQGSSISPAVAPAGIEQQLAFRLSTDDSIMARNGATANWIFDGAIPNVLTRLGIGTSPSGAEARLGGIIRRIVIFPFALTDSDLVVQTGGPAYPAGTITWQRMTKAAAFSHRDSALTFKLGSRQFIARGYQLNTVLLNDIWSSASGIDYSLVNANPSYEEFSHVTALDGKIYAFKTKMYESEDGGQTFTEILADLPWGQLSGDAPVIVHNGKLLAFYSTGNSPVGGTEGVWEFDPVAVEWWLICAAPWGARMVPAVTEFDGDLYLYGGFRNVSNVPPEIGYPDKTSLNDVWKSTDGGLTWAQIVEVMPCQPRIWPAFIEHLGRLYLLGGYDNVSAAHSNYADTWVSDDGVSWQQLIAVQPYLQRHAPVAYVFNGELFLVSGNANAAAPTQTLNDIWKLIL